MSTSSTLREASLDQFLAQQKKVPRNLEPAALVEPAIRRGEGRLASNGALVAETGQYTGRTPKDKFTVNDSTAADKVKWGGFNVEFDPDKFDALYDRVLDFLQGKELFVQDLFAGADRNFRLPIRVIN